MLTTNLNFRQPVPKELIKVTSSALTHPSYVFMLIYHHAVLAFNPCFNKKLMWLALILCMLCCFTVSGQIILWIHRRATAKNFHHQKIILFLFTRKCQNAAENSEDNLLLKNDFFEFSRYSGFILQVRWTKAKLLMSNLFRILCTENYSNQFIFDWVIQYN